MYFYRCAHCLHNDYSAVCNIHGVDAFISKCEMMKTKVILLLDISCSGCDKYIKALEFWCSFYDMDLSIKRLDDNPMEIWEFIKQLKAIGHQVEYMPLLVVSQDDKSYTEAGILSPGRVQQFLTKIDNIKQ